MNMYNDSLDGYMTWCLLHQHYDLSHFYSLAKEKSRLLSLALEVFDDGGWGPFAESYSYHRSLHTVI